ncbi:MAG: hypothetical protein LBD23_13010 [Oscillospiraceae bacterium]|jgi:hypothetical protein|nr:hypothetical protein [Oscillospiraceae bacterium]
MKYPILSEEEMIVIHNRADKICRERLNVMSAVRTDSKHFLPSDTKFPQEWYEGVHCNDEALPEIGNVDDVIYKSTIVFNEFHRYLNEKYGD